MGLFLWVRRHGSNTKSHQTQRDVSMTLLQVCHKLWIFVADNHDSLMEALSQLLSVSGLEKRLGEYSGRQLSNLYHAARRTTSPVQIHCTRCYKASGGLALTSGALALHPP